MRLPLAPAALLLLAACGGTIRHSPPPLAASDGIPLGALPRQALGTGECGVFLWIAGPPARLVLMAKSGPPPFAHILLDGATLDLPRLAGADPAQDENARYGDGRVTVSLDLTIAPRKGLAAGAVVQAGSLRIDRVAGDALVVPVSGLVACG